MIKVTRTQTSMKLCELRAGAVFFVAGVEEEVYQKVTISDAFILAGEDELVPVCDLKKGAVFTLNKDIIVVPANTADMKITF